jgi:putative membrane protein
MIALHAGLQADSIWASWSLDPTALIGIPLAAWLYARGLRSLGQRKRYHGSWRPWVFYGGLAVIFLALASPLDHLSEELFAAHMTQHVLLMMVGVPMVLLGAPMIPMLRGVPRPVRRSAVIPVAKSLPMRALLRTVTRPLIAWPLYVGVLLGWHLPALFDAALANETLHTIEHLVFAFAAYVFWWNIIDPLPLRPNLAYLARVPYIFLTVVPAFALGAFLTFATSPWFDHYAETTARYGLTRLDDQQLGGVIMWIPGSFIIGTALIVDLYLAVRVEQQNQLRQEER